MQLRLQEILCILQSKLPQVRLLYAGGCEDIVVLSVCRDTRDVATGCLFVCLQGQQHDGHDFASQAVSAGAVALLVSRPLEGIDVPQICVPDTLKALGALAQGWRRRFSGSVIVITGSAGKTTCKTVLADVLAQALSGEKLVARSMGNYNNQVGLPLSILATRGDERVWVLEAGISEAHDMDELGAIAEPDVAVVLNVGMAHTQGLGEKGVAWHKAQLLKYVRPDGVAVVSADYAELVACAHTAFGGNIRFFSCTEKDAPCRAHFVCSHVHGVGEYAVTCSGKGETYLVQAPFVGAYGAEHVAAILSVTEALHLPVADVVKAFAHARLPQQRFEEHCVGAWRIIDDSYNANPLSMQRMLEAALTKSASASCAVPCYVVLGSMAELGQEAVKAHEELGRYLGKLCEKGLAYVFWKGQYAECVQRGMASAMERAGVAMPDRATFVPVSDLDDFTRAWTAAALLPGTILCKGSRSQRVDECVGWLLQAVVHKDEDTSGGTDVL